MARLVAGSSCRRRLGLLCWLVIDEEKERQILLPLVLESPAEVESSSFAFLLK